MDILLDKSARLSILKFSELTNTLRHSVFTYSHSLDGRHHDYKDLQGKHAVLVGLVSDSFTGFYIHTSNASIKCQVYTFRNRTLDDGFPIPTVTLDVVIRL